jgi:uncharacterized membrane protein
MEARPKFKVKLTQADKTIEVIGLVLIFVVWVFVYFNYDNLPDTIPIHFNGAALADSFGDQWIILPLHTHL